MSLPFLTLSAANRIRYTLYFSCCTSILHPILWNSRNCIINPVFGRTNTRFAFTLESRRESVRASTSRNQIASDVIVVSTPFREKFEEWVRASRQIPHSVQLRQREIRRVEEQTKWNGRKNKSKSSQLNGFSIQCDFNAICMLCECACLHLQAPLQTKQWLHTFRKLALSIADIFAWHVR